MAEEKADSTTGLMDPDSKEFQSMLADMQSRSGEKAEASTDEKQATPASSAEQDEKADSTTAEKADAKTEKADAKDKADEKPETDPVKLQAQVTGLKAELKRVREQRQSPEEVAKLNEKLAHLEGRLEQLSKPAGTTRPKYTVEQLETGKANLLRLVAQAERDGNDEKAAEYAGNIVWCDREIRKLEKDASSAESKNAVERDGLVQEATSLYEEALTLFPDLNDKDSELWKASNAEFTKRPRFMKALGPYADAIAVSMAIAKNPKLVPSNGNGKDTKTEARKELLDNLDKAADKALLKGSGAADTKTTFDFATASVADIDGIAERLKRNERVSL